MVCAILTPHYSLLLSQLSSSFSFFFPETVKEPLNYFPRTHSCPLSIYFPHYGTGEVYFQLPFLYSDTVECSTNWAEHKPFIRSLELSRSDANSFQTFLWMRGSILSTHTTTTAAAATKRQTKFRKAEEWTYSRIWNKQQKKLICRKIKQWHRCVERSWDRRREKSPWILYDFLLFWFCFLCAIWLPACPWAGSTR